MNKKIFIIPLSMLLLAACTSAVVEATPVPQPTENPATPTPVPPTAIAPGSVAGETRLDAFGIEQVWVPAGSFMMGAEDAELLDGMPDWASKSAKSEGPQHEVTLTQGYWIDKTEVTNASFQAFVDDGGYQAPEHWSEAGQRWLDKQLGVSLPHDCDEEAHPDHPRVCINWYEAEAYTHWRGGSLPSEAQWEYAARGPESLIYPWGNEWHPAMANVTGSTGLASVGSYPDGASWVGAMDMSGNAMEWVNDWLGWFYYKEDVKIDPPGPETGTIKIEKGGWWGAPAFTARASYRHFEDNPMYQDHHIGFRIVVMP